MQPGLELEEVQVAPRAAQAVMNRLCAGTTGRARQRRALAADLEVDPALGRVELRSSTLASQFSAKASGCWHINQQVDSSREANLRDSCSANPSD
jgi:hypothetical protein